MLPLPCNNYVEVRTMFVDSKCTKIPPFARLLTWKSVKKRSPTTSSWPSSSVHSRSLAMSSDSFPTIVTFMIVGRVFQEHFEIYAPTLIIILVLRNNFSLRNSKNCAAKSIWYPICPVKNCYSSTPSPNIFPSIKSEILVCISKIQFGPFLCAFIIKA